MIDTAALKNNILELAFKGELVSKVEGDGCISDLIDTIPNPSNKRLGLLKKGSDTVFPYDLPDNWKIVPLGRITSYGDTPKKTIASDVSSDTWILELEDIESGGRLLKKTRVDSRQAIGEKTTFNCGQVLYSKLRPYLKKVLQADEDGICTPELIAFDVYAGINPRYVMYYLICNFVDKVINQRSYGVKMPRVDAQFMVNLPVPLPTIAVQNKIVDIIDEAFSAVEKINEYQAQYSSDLEVLKSKIIDAGIQGKLTKQLPEDGTAEELLEQIAKEKKQLIKKKKIKATKALPEISEDEIPFEIPDTWKYVRIGDVCELNPKNDLSDDLEVSFIPMACVTEGYNNKHSFEIKKWGDIKKGFNHFQNNDVGVAKITPCFQNRKSVVFRDLLEGYGAGTTELSIVRGYEGMICPDYLLWFFKSAYFINNGIESFTGVVGQQRIHKDYLKMCVLPLPPYSEQLRIADKINSAIATVENM